MSYADLSPAESLASEHSEPTLLLKSPESNKHASATPDVTPKSRNALHALRGAVGYL